MSEVTLQTKLYIPRPRPDLVSRPYLLDILNGDVRLGAKLVLVSAPAGFGKTTLVTEWVHTPEPWGTNPPEFAWISLDEPELWGWLKVKGAASTVDRKSEFTQTYLQMFVDQGFLTQGHLSLCNPTIGRGSGDSQPYQQLIEDHGLLAQGQ